MQALWPSRGYVPKRASNNPITSAGRCPLWALGRAAADRRIGARQAWRQRTGRPFTGDHAGILLYQTLHKFGLASGPVSTAADDELQLLDARITNSVKCLPPANKPLPVEINTCNEFLRAELAQMPRARVILALGAVAHAAVLRACGLPNSGHRFAHAAEHSLPMDRVLLDSYHCSRYNTQTRRLTTAMFEGVIGRARDLAHAARQE